MFDWNDMRYFLYFAKYGSISSVARHLKVDHATVSRRLTSLECYLKIKLFDKRSRSYVLTKEGEKIAALGNKMENQAFNIERACIIENQLINYEISISAPPMMATEIIAPLLYKLQLTHPNIHIRLIGEARFASLLEMEADLAIGLLRPTEPELVARTIAQVVFGLYATPAYLAENAPENYKFIAYDDSLDECRQQNWLKAFAHNRPIVLRTNNLDIQWSAARSHMGVAALPCFLGSRDPRLQQLHIDQEPLISKIWLATHSDLRNVETIRIVMDFLIDCFEDMSA